MKSIRLTPAVLLCASVIVVLLNLRFTSLYSLDFDTVDEVVGFESSIAGAGTAFHPGIFLGFIPYMALKSAGLNLFESLRANFAIYGILALISYFYFSFCILRNAFLASACTLLFALTPAVQFVERFLDDNFLSYAVLFLGLALCLGQGPPTKRFALRIVASMSLFAILFYFQPGFVPAMTLAAAALAYRSFFDRWTWKDRFYYAAIAIASLVVAAGIVNVALGLWLQQSPEQILHGMVSVLGTDLSPEVRATLTNMMDRSGIFSFGIKHSLFGMSLLHGLDLNDLTYVLIGYGEMKGNFNGVILGILATIGFALWQWRKKETRAQIYALTFTTGLVVLCAWNYQLSNLVSQQERFDVLVLLYPLLLIQVNRTQITSPQNVFIGALFLAIFACGLFAFFSPSSPRSSWQAMAKLKPEGKYKSYFYSESEVKDAPESVSLHMLGATPLYVIENPDGGLGVLSMIQWARAHYRISLEKTKALDLNGAYLSTNARALVSKKP